MKQPEELLSMQLKAFFTAHVNILVGKSPSLRTGTTMAELVIEKENIIILADGLKWQSQMMDTVGLPQ